MAGIRAAVPVLKAELDARQAREHATNDSRNNAVPGTSASFAHLKKQCGENQDGTPGAYIVALVSHLSQQNVDEAIRVFNQVRTMNLSSGPSFDPCVIDDKRQC